MQIVELSEISGYSYYRSRFGKIVVSEGFVLWGGVRFFMDAAGRINVLPIVALIPLYSERKATC